MHTPIIIELDYHNELFWQLYWDMFINIGGHGIEHTWKAKRESYDTFSGRLTYV